MLAEKITTAPGPSGFFNIITSIRSMGFLDYVDSLWTTYGDVFRLKLGGRDMIFAMHPDAVRHVSITNRQNYDKVRSYDNVRRFLIGDGLIASRGDLWKQQRKLMAPFYTPRGVQTYAEMMLRDGFRLVERWEKLAPGGATVQIAEEMTLVTASIILKAMFSMETDEEIVGMKNAVETLITYVSSGQSAPLALPHWVPTRRNRDYREARNRVHSYINSIFEARRATPEANWPDDLLTKLMQARDEETGSAMSETLLRDESVTTFFAGHETTARTMTFVWYALATNAEVEAKLHAELDSVLGEQAPTVEDLHRLPYTLQVIKETLRLYPAAPFYVRDAVGDDTLDGYPVRAGASIMLSPYFTHRHPEFWDDPLRFDPERWTSEREAERHPYAYHPFAAGQRVCIGNNFSLLETHILLALLARRFSPRLADGFVPRFMMQGTLGTSNGMPMVIRAR
jgi:cytochrome P450